MPRQTHRAEEERIEAIHDYTVIILPPKMRRFLEFEAARLTDKDRLIKRSARRVTPQTIIRALVTAYYEKRTIGLLVNPND